MKRGWIWALGALGVLALVGAIVIALLSNQAVTTSVAKRGLAQFAGQLPAQVAFGHLSVSPLQGRVALDDLVISLPGHPGEKLLTARQAIADVDLGALMRRQVHIRKLHLVDPSATIIHRGHNHYNLEDLLPKGEAKQQPNNQASVLTLSELTIDGGHVTYLDAPRQLEAELPHVKASLALDLPVQHISGSLSTSDGWASYQGRREPVDSFLADFRLLGENLGLDRVKVQAGQTDLAVRGSLDHLGKPDMGLSLEGLAKTRLEQWAPFAKQPLAGQVQADYQIQGTTSEPRVAARLSGQDLSYKALKLARVSAKVATGADSLRVDDLVANIWSGRITGRATVPLRKGGRLSADARADNLDLAAAARELALKGTRGLTGRASAQVHASGDRLAPEAIVADGWVRADGEVPVNGKTLPLAARTDFRWDAGELDLTRLDATALGGHVSGEGRVTPLARVPAYAVTAHVDTLSLDRVATLIGKPLPVTGQVGADVTLSGKDFRHPELAGTGHVNAMGALKPNQGGNKRALPFTGQANLSFAGRDVRITTAHVAALGGTATASGTIGLAGPKPRIDLDVDARNVDLHDLDQTYALAQGRLSGRADARVQLAGQTVDVRQAIARTLGGTVAASGRVLLTGKQPSYALAVHAHAIDIATAARTFRVAKVPLSGKAGADLRLSGTGPHFRAAGPVEASGTAHVPDRLAPGTTGPLPFHLAARVDAGSRQVAFSPLTAKVGASTLNAHGTLSLDSTSNLVVTGRVVDGPAIAAVFGVKGLTGGVTTLSAHAAGTPGHVQLGATLATTHTRLQVKTGFETAHLTLTGTLTNRLALDGTLLADQVLVSGKPIKRVSTGLAYDAPATRLASGTLSANGLTVALEKGRVTGATSVDLGRRAYTADLRTQGLTLGELGAAEAGVPPATGISLAFNGRGTLADPHGKAHIFVQGFRFSGQSVGPSDVTANLLGERLGVNGGLLGKEVALSGSLPLHTGRAGLLLLRFNDVHLAPLFAMAPRSLGEQIEVPVDGQLAGQVALTGPITHPDRMRMAVNLARLRLAYRDLMLENQGPVKLRYADHYLHVDALHVTGQGTNLTATGALGLGAPSDFTASGTVNLGLLEKLSPKNFADASGTARINATLKGTFGRPDLLGSLGIRNGELTTRNLPQAIRNLNATVRLDHNRLFLDRLRATLGYTGKIDAFGGATLSTGPGFAVQAVNLQLTGRELAVRVPDTNALLDADLAFSGTPDDAVLDGQIKVLEAKYTKDIPLTGGLTSHGHAPGPDFSKIPFLRGLTMRVQVSAPGQIVVKNNLADMELRGDLMITGTPAAPGLVGRTETLPGAKITFQDRTYDVSEATVDFVDPSQIKPYLHLVATTTVQSVDVSLSANGTPDALKLDLKSTPYMPQSDILTLLATGQTPAQLAQGTGSGGAALSNLLVNQVAKGVERGISDQGAVDVLRIQPGSTTSGQATGGSLTVGKRINDRLMITYTQDLTNTTTGQPPGRAVIFDYNLTDYLVLKMQQDLSGGFSASARYRYPIR